MPPSRVYPVTPSPLCCQPAPLGALFVQALCLGQPLGLVAPGCQRRDAEPGTWPCGFVRCSGDLLGSLPSCPAGLDGLVTCWLWLGVGGARNSSRGASPQCRSPAPADPSLSASLLSHAAAADARNAAEDAAADAGSVRCGYLEGKGNPSATNRSLARAVDV